MAGPQRALDAELERDERMVRLQAAIDGLPVRLREATVLRWEREMAYEEIAEALAISPAAARQLVSRALRLLRQELAG
jgi:RNA polymerase sigma factor (sigma-70 family)